MELSLIVPPDFVEYTRFLPGRFCIAPVALADERYYKFFKESTNVILDNGAFEGKLLTDEALHEMAIDMGVHTVVVPDLYGGNAEENFKKGLAYKEKFPDAPYFLMFVCQAEKRGLAWAGEQERFWKVLKEAMTVFHCISIPRVATHNLYADTAKTMSQELLRFIFSYELQKNISQRELEYRNFHLLGVGDELYMLEHFWWVSSMDTASLFWQSWLGNYIPKDGILKTEIARPKHYFHLEERDTPLDFKNALKKNCEAAMKYASKAKELRRLITGNLY